MDLSMVRIVCFEVSPLNRHLKPASHFQNLLDTCAHLSCPHFLTKITWKTLLDHKDNLIHLGSLLVSYLH